MIHEPDGDVPVPSLCTISHNNDEYLFAYGIDKDYDDDYVTTNAELYSFKSKEWSVLPKQEIVIDEIRDEFSNAFCTDKGGASICYDAKRNRVYVSGSVSIECYDFNDNKWRNDIFPPFPDEYSSTRVNVIFLDKISCDQLWSASTESPLFYIDLNELNEWEICEEMQFVDILEESPNYSFATFERFFCSR